MPSLEIEWTLKRTIDLKARLLAPVRFIWCRWESEQLPEISSEQLFPLSVACRLTRDRRASTSAPEWSMMAPDDRISQPAQREVMDGWMDGMVVSRSAVTGAEGANHKTTSGPWRVGRPSSSRSSGWFRRKFRSIEVKGWRVAADETKQWPQRYWPDHLYMMAGDKR